MKKRIVAIAMLLLIALAAICTFLQLRGSQLDEACLSEVIDRTRQKYNIPAISISVMNSEQILCTVFDGVRVYGEEDSIIEDDYFHIGSCAKSVLAYMAAKLIEEGLINFDTRFFDIYPELKTSALEDYYDITLEDLLSCRAGIKPYTSGLETYPDLSASRDRELDFIRYLLSLPPASGRSDLGKYEFLYSNAGFTLASAMLEKASRLSWEELLQKYIIGELGIDVFIGWPYEKSQNQPWGHLPGMDNTLTVIGPDSGYALNPLIWPAGNISMTGEGFTQYVQLHLQGLTEKETQLDSTTFKYIDTKYNEFSLGAWNGTKVGKQYICLDGTAGTFYTRGVIIPDSNFAFTVMMNSGSEQAADYITMQLMKACHNWWWWMFWI